MKNHMVIIGAATTCMIALLGIDAAAESPWHYRFVVIDGGFTDARTAHRIEAPEKGHVGYHHARDKAPALWFRFEGGYGDRITLRLGMPALDRQRQLRPAMAVLGPGLPPLAEEVPFEIPEGFGGYIYHSAGLDIERHTNNHYGVISWRFAAIEHVLDHAGRVYVVGFIPVPEDEEARNAYPDGKFWMTVGREVNFKLGDIFGIYTRTSRVRSFFEAATTQSWLYRNGILGLLLALVGIILAVV